MSDVPTSNDNLERLRERFDERDRPFTRAHIEALFNEASALSRDLAKVQGELDAAEQHVRILQSQRCAPETPAGLPLTYDSSMPPGFLHNCGYHGTASGWIVRDGTLWIATFGNQGLADQYIGMRTLSARPTAWYRGVQTAGSPNDPPEYDVEMSYGDDQPEGNGWIPLFRRVANEVSTPEKATERCKHGVWLGDYCYRCESEKTDSAKCEHGIPRRFCTAVHASLEQPHADTFVDSITTDSVSPPRGESL